MSSGDVILTSQHNPPMQDIAQALTNSLDRDGKGGMRAPLLMGGNRIVNAAPGVDPSDVATVAQLAGSSGGGIPIGAVIDFWGGVVPEGFLFCYGQEVSRSTFSGLFAVIGTSAGPGNGSTTFNVPDYRGRTGAGRDNMGGAAANRLTTGGAGINGSTLGAAGGAQTHTLTQAQMPGHTHTLSGSTNSAGAHTHTVQSAQISGDGGIGGGGFAANPFLATTSSDGAHSHTLSGTAASTGGGAAHPNVQPTIVANKIIRAL